MLVKGTRQTDYYGRPCTIVDLFLTVTEPFRVMEGRETRDGQGPRCTFLLRGSGCRTKEISGVRNK